MTSLNRAHPWSSPMKISAQRGTSFAAMTSSHSNLFHNFPRKRLKSLEAQFCRNALNFFEQFAKKPTDILTSSQRRRRHRRRRCRQRRRVVFASTHKFLSFRSSTWTHLGNIPHESSIKRGGNRNFNSSLNLSHSLSLSLSHTHTHSYTLPLCLNVCASKINKVEATEIQKHPSKG